MSLETILTETTKAIDVFPMLSALMLILWVALVVLLLGNKWLKHS